LNTNPDHKVVGYVLSHPDRDFFASKLRRYDRIEDYFSDDPVNSCYQRDVVEVHLCDENDMPTLQMASCYVYHKPQKEGGDKPVRNGDWLQRDTVHNPYDLNLVRRILDPDDDMNNDLINIAQFKNNMKRYYTIIISLGSTPELFFDMCHFKNSQLDILA
jgi:gamma-glutamylcyclotransferase (GGCT)/AIG2-like uncharacterized protein YtfP